MGVCISSFCKISCLVEEEEEASPLELNQNAAKNMRGAASDSPRANPEHLGDVMGNVAYIKRTRSGPRQVARVF